MDRQLSRRTLLASLATSACLTAPALTAPALAGSALDTVPLYPDDSHSLYRVRMLLDVEGNAEVPKNDLAKDDVRKLGVKANTVIDYEENITRDPDGLPKAARRYYYEAATNSKIQSNDKKSGLRNQARRVTVQLDETRAVLFGDNTSLTHDELSLLRTPINSVVIDRLLPYKSLKKGESWEIPTDILASLFDMDGIQKSNISGKVTDFDTVAAKMELAGSMEASVDGVPTSIRLQAKMTFDRKQRSITWLAIALREDRGVGRAEPGFELAAKIRIIRQAMVKPHALKNATPVAYEAEPGGDKLLVDVRSAGEAFGVFCDRGWRVMTSTDQATMLRMIKNDNVIAQCDVRSMPVLKDGHQLTLEAFQQDIKRTVGERLGEFVEAEEKVTSNGVRLLRVVVQGTVQGIPVQWIYQHFSNDSGLRTAAIFTVADKQLEEFGGSDIQFAEGFRFMARSNNDAAAKDKTVAAAEPAKTKPVEQEVAEEVATKPKENGALQLNPVLR